MSLLNCIPQSFDPPVELEQYFADCARWPERVNAMSFEKLQLLRLELTTRTDELASLDLDVLPEGVATSFNELMAAEVSGYLEAQEGDDEDLLLEGLSASDDEDEPDTEAYITDLRNLYNDYQAEEQQATAQSISNRIATIKAEIATIEQRLDDWGTDSTQYWASNEAEKQNTYDAAHPAAKATEEMFGDNGSYMDRMERELHRGIDVDPMREVYRPTQVEYDANPTAFRSAPLPTTNRRVIPDRRMLTLDNSLWEIAPDMLSVRLSIIHEALAPTGRTRFASTIHKHVDTHETFNHRVSVADAHEPREFFHGLASEFLLDSINVVRPQDLSLTGSDLVAPEQIATSEPAIEPNYPEAEKDWAGTNLRQAQARKELFEVLARSEARQKLHLATCFLFERGNHTNKLYAIYGKQFIDSQRPKWREARLRLNALYMEVELDEATPKEIEEKARFDAWRTAKGRSGTKRNIWYREMCLREQVVSQAMALAEAKSHFRLLVGMADFPNKSKTLLDWAANVNCPKLMAKGIRKAQRLLVDNRPQAETLDHIGQQVVERMVDGKVRFSVVDQSRPKPNRQSAEWIVEQTQTVNFVLVPQADPLNNIEKLPALVVLPPQPPKRK